MALFNQCFDPDDFADLTLEDLDILKRIMLHELHTSDDIRRILRDRVRQALNDLRQKRSSGNP